MNFPKKPKPISAQLLLEEISTLKKTNFQLSKNNKLLENRISRLEIVVTKIVDNQNKVRSKHKYLREQLNSISNRLSTLNTPRRQTTSFKW